MLSYFLLLGKLLPVLALTLHVTQAEGFILGVGAKMITVAWNAIAYGLSVRTD